MPRGASLTAEWVCLMRALEQARPPAARVIDDPLAARLLSPALRACLTPPLPQLLMALDGAMGPAPGLRGPAWPELWALPLAPLQVLHFVAARHRFIDDAVLGALGDGVEQVVLLGAGYDTRAWRFAPLLGGRPVWELDFPATQARKRALLARHGDLDPGRAHFVAVDFGHEDFGERLVAAGFPVGARTAWLWEGVSMYLDAATVARTLATLGALGGPGSVLAADFWHEPPGHPVWRWAHRTGARLFGAIGEPLRFQLAPEQAPDFLAAHGFTVDELLDGAALTARYAMAGRPVFGPLYLVRAHTPTRNVVGDTAKPN